MKKKLFAVLMAAAMVFGMTACGSGESADTTAETTGDEAQLEDFSIVLDWYPNAVHAFLYDAIEKGYFAEEGLNLVIQFPANTNDGISLPAAGKADAGVYYMQDAIMTSVEENVPIVSIGAVTQKSMNVVISLKDSGITEAKDLAGKKIGTQRGTTGYIYCSDDFGDDAVVAYDNGLTAVQALNNGQVDAVVIDNAPAKEYVAANPGLKVLDTSYAEEDYAIGMAKGSSLEAAVNAALEELKADGTLQAIVDKYITAE